MSVEIRRIRSVELPPAAYVKVISRLGSVLEVYSNYSIADKKESLDFAKKMYQQDKNDEILIINLEDGQEECCIGITTDKARQLAEALLSMVNYIERVE